MDCVKTGEKESHRQGMLEDMFEFIRIGYFEQRHDVESFLYSS